MRGSRRRDLERALRAAYRAERSAPDDDAMRDVVAAVRAEAARQVRTGVSAGAGSVAESPVLAAAPGFASFVAGQVRFISPRVWVAQAALMVAMAALCLAGATTPGGLGLATSLLGAATVLVGLPDLFASKTQGVAEVEYACLFDCRAAAIARLVILGCSDVVAVSCIALASPLFAGTSVLDAFLHACVPYFLACAGSLVVARRSAGPSVLPLAFAWTALVMAASFAAFTLAPVVYASASAGMWSLACAASLAWAAREVRAWLRCIAAGLDHLAPAHSPR